MKSRIVEDVALEYQLKSKDLGKKLKNMDNMMQVKENDRNAEKVSLKKQIEVQQKTIKRLEDELEKEPLPRIGKKLPTTPNSNDIHSNTKQSTNPRRRNFLYVAQ